MKDSILFIEDLDEYLYHLDRMMMNLKLSGVLKNINGLIVGGMSEMNDNTIPFGKNAIEIISEHASKLGIPLCFGFPAGHQFENRPLILGREIELNVGAEEVKINY
jgi:muramoyltetrapeptide carboxypeptidase